MSENALIHKKRFSKSISDRAFGIINTALVTIVMLIVLYPLYFTVIASFSNPYEIYKGNVLLYPAGFTWDAYKNVFKNSEIWQGYVNSIINTALTVVYSLAVTIPCAYVMSRKYFRGRGILTVFFVFTMYFGGGMIPGYLLIKQLGLINTRWALIVGGGFSVYNMIITRTFYTTNFPDELYEAARIDGANELRIFVSVALPLSGAIIAVIALYNAVGSWNSFFSVLLYIDSKKLYTLQYVLRNILIQNQQMTIIESMNSMDSLQVEALLKRKLMAESMKYSIIFISSAPMLIAYPFVQKHFVKGVMIGSLKG